MPILTIRHVAVTGAKADFVKHSIRVTLDLPLTDENLGLRSKLAWLAMEKESVTITLESAQLPLFDDVEQLKAAFEHAGKQIIAQSGDVDVSQVTHNAIAHANRAVNPETGEITDKQSFFDRAVE